MHIKVRYSILSKMPRMFLPWILYRNYLNMTTHYICRKRHWTCSNFHQIFVKSGWFFEHKRFFWCCIYRIRTHELSVNEKFEKLMDPDFKGAFLTTESTVSYYNMKHSANNKLVVRPTLDRVLLMVYKH